MIQRIFIIALTFLLSACQTGAATQFVVPCTKQDELVHAIEEVGKSNGMTNKMAEALVVGVYSYYQVSDAGGYMMVGARKHEGMCIVDVSAYTAGLYDKKQFQDLEVQMSKKLAGIFGGSVRVIRNPKELIQMERKNT